MEYIYIIKEREFIKTKEEIYKIGRTQNFLNRFKQYPKNSMIIFVQIVNNSTQIEKNIIRDLILNTKQRKDIGNEYFEADCKKIIKIVYDICNMEEDKIIENFVVIDPKSETYEIQKNKIEEIDKILVIEDNNYNKTFTKDETKEIIEKIYPMVNNLKNLFKIREQVIKEHIKFEKRKRQNVLYTLNQIYKKWNGCGFILQSEKKMKNTERNYEYWFKIIPKSD
jgi:hypothetical protein